MESTCTSIKVEPVTTVCTPSEDIANPHDYSKHSCKNVNNIGETNNPVSQPEFVNIKVEPEIYDESVVTEPSSPKSDSTWHNVPVKYEPDVHQINVEVSIKEEPTDTEVTQDENSDYIIPDSEVPIAPNLFISNISEQILSLNSTIDGKYICPICQKRFSNKGNVQRHILLHTRDKLECNVCFRQFVKQGHYERHLLTHSREKRYQCDECEKLFRSSSNLEQHKRTHLTVKPFECQTCTRQFAIKANLKKHQSTGKCKRPSTDPIVCNVCNKVFQKEFLLKSHLRRHTTERPFTCEKCKMSFKYKSTLIRHVQLHNNIKPYSCNICKKKFTHSGLIKPHMRKHTGEKPYLCPICNKSFAHKHNMQRHTLRHSKIKNLVCEICNKKFPKESRLIYHMRTHTNAKPFLCGICTKTFSHRQNIVRHYGRKHPGCKYESPDTDASVAKICWQSVMKGNMEIKANITKVDNSSDDEILSDLKTEKIVGK